MSSHNICFNREKNKILFLTDHQIPTLSFFYAPNFEEVDRAYWFRVVRACVRGCVLSCVLSCLFIKNRAC